jgi:hypothetical protein
MYKVLSKYQNANAKAEQEFMQGFGEWLRNFKPDAKTFEFYYNSELNDEGGSYTRFESLYIDDVNFEEIAGELTREKFNELLDANILEGDWNDEDDYGKEQYISDAIQEFMYNIPDFALQRAKFTIK